MNQHRQRMIADKILRALPAAIVARTLGTIALPARTVPPAKPAPPVREALDAPIVIEGVRDIAVNGRARQCETLPGDPLNRIHDNGAFLYPQLIALLPSDLKAAASKDPPVPRPDQLVWTANREQITGPGYWQRMRFGADRFVYRGAGDGQPQRGEVMCIGGTGDVEMNSLGGFRRILDAAPYRGKRLRFSAWVTTGRAKQVSFWLAAGTPWKAQDGKPYFIRPNTPDFSLLNGGTTNSVRLGGNQGWRRMVLETGPIHWNADHVSYGFNLQGSGNVWVYQPRLEVIPEDRQEVQSDLFLRIGTVDEGMRVDVNGGARRRVEEEEDDGGA